MRKAFLLAMVMCFAAMGNAQLLKVSSVEKVPLPESASASISTISPDGSFVLVTDNFKSGISKWDISSAAYTQVSSTGYSVSILDDCSTIVYRENSFDENHLRYVSVKTLDLATKKVATIVAPTRNLNGVAVAGNTVTAIDSRRATVKAVKGVKESRPTASIDKGQLCITVNGKTSVISPNGREGQSYLWPSVSPDGKKVVYYLAATGCFVANIDGSNPVALGILRAAKWYDNNTVVGMVDHDNGEFVTSSSLMAVSADGKIRQEIAPENAMAMYPSISADGSKISYTTPAGGLYIMNITK
ncbi:MAG: hypothetical protein PUG32_02930 [Bacteroidales bacterium]|nr:hypothetical protein [Bacteroidales bacterium]